MGPAGLFRRSQRAWPWPLGRGAGPALGPAAAAGTRGGSAVQAGRWEEGWKGRRARCWLSPPAGTCRESGPQRRPPLRGRDSWRTRWDPPLTCWCPARHANSPGRSWRSCERVQLREKTREGPGGAWRGNAGAGLGGVAARHRSARWVGHAAHAVPTASTPRAGLGPGVLPGSPEPLPTPPPPVARPCASPGDWPRLPAWGSGGRHLLSPAVFELSPQVAGGPEPRAHEPVPSAGVRLVSLAFKHLRGPVPERPGRRTGPPEPCRPGDAPAAGWAMATLRWAKEMLPAATHRGGCLPPWA